MDKKQLIESLIKDLCENKSLSEVFLKLQTIVFLLKNEKITKWFDNENNGYKSEDNLPEYRILPALLNATIIQNRGWGNSLYYEKFLLPFDIIDKKYVEYLNKVKIYDSISNFSNSMSRKGVYCKPLPIATANFCKLEENCYIQKIWQEIPINYFEEMISKIKSKLLQFLLEINENLNLNISFTEMENKEKIERAFNQNITNNIFGNNNNVSTGQNVEQTINQSFVDYEKLKEYGVEEQDIAELKIIEKEPDKNTLKNKMLSWLEKVSAAVAARGLYDNIPAIIECVKVLI
ncbi:MAG: hypothetical protein LBT27_01585 [Prevotellaceae bacterium]|jgi:hypothetical protein|nr:hypothetical protein [Prevotellaceae bacterium]